MRKFPKTEADLKTETEKLLKQHNEDPSRADTAWYLAFKTAEQLRELSTKDLAEFLQDGIPVPTFEAWLETWEFEEFEPGEAEAILENDLREFFGLPRA